MPRRNGAAVAGGASLSLAVRQATLVSEEKRNIQRFRTLELSEFKSQSILVPFLRIYYFITTSLVIHRYAATNSTSIYN